MNGLDEEEIVDMELKEKEEEEDCSPMKKRRGSSKSSSFWLAQVAGVAVYC